MTTSAKRGVNIGDTRGKIAIAACPFLISLRVMVNGRLR